MEWRPIPARARQPGVLENISRLFQQMPKNVATVFTMREVDGVESKEICRR